MTNGITRKIAGALVLAGATTAFAGETDSGRRKPSIAWAKSFDEAVQEASERNLPILVHAHASTCPPCTSLRRAVLEDADYVKWSDSTIHVMSYYVDPEEEGGELQKEVEREDGKVSVLAAFPDFTLDEMRMLARGLDRRLKIPEKTPWSGVVSPDGRTILWEKQGKATAKEYREAYDAEAKKLGKALPRAEWKRALGLVERSVAAEVDERWKDAVLPLKEVHAAAAEYPPALRGRIEGQIEAIQAARDRLREEAEKTKDPAARAKAVAAVDAAFEGLPALGSAPAKDSTPR